MSDFVSSDLILHQNMPISSAKVLILIDKYGKEYVDEYGNSYGKEIFKNFLIEKIEENIEEIGFNFDDSDLTKEHIINSFSEYYDKITENNDKKFDTSMQRRKDESDKLLFCKIVVCIIHKKIFINHYGLNDVVDFNDIIHYINNNHGNSPTKDGSDISKYKDRLIKRARKIDKDILENKIPISKPLKKSIKFPLSDSPVNTTQDTLFNFAPLSDFAPVSALASAAPIYGIGQDTSPFKHELLNEDMEEDEEDEENDYELSNRGMKMIDDDFKGSPHEFDLLNEINSNNQEDMMVLDDDDDDNIFDFDEDEELPEVNRGGKKTRKKRKNKTKKRKNKRNRKSKKK